MNEGVDRVDALDGGSAGGVETALLSRVRRRLAAEPAALEPTAARIARALHAEGRVLDDSTSIRLVRLLTAEIAGAGVLEPLLADPSVTDVLVHGPAHVWVDRGSGLERSPLSFRDDAEVRRLAQRLASSGGRRLDDAEPWVDVRLPAGGRLHAVLPPVALDGTCLALRLPRRRPFTLAELVAAGTLDHEVAEVLRGLVAARAALLVSGGTGSGKTTLLATLLGLVPASERIVLVEDCSELRPDHPHVVRLEGRPANVEGSGAVTLRDLVRQALRMRPDRLVVGEVRGAEVVDLLAALNTGHEGGCGTVHANSARDVPARLEALATAGGLDRHAVHSQVAAGLEVVVHLHRDASGLRRVAEVAVPVRGRDGTVRMAPALIVASSGGVVAGEAAAALRRLLARSP
jgi:pilus assembly protein CpaF